MAGNGIPQAVQTVCGTLRRAGWEAYPVGGCVRDLLLGRTPGDWDVCTAAPPEAVEDLFPHTVPTGVKHGTVTVLTDGMAVEVTTFRREGGYADGRHPDAVTFDASLTQDLSRRDFTVNAMALSPDGAVIDPFGGRADLAAGLIRCVGRPEARFAEDALRMLRGCALPPNWALRWRRRPGGPWRRRRRGRRRCRASASARSWRRPCSPPGRSWRGRWSGWAF